MSDDKYAEEEGSEEEEETGELDADEAVTRWGWKDVC
jgi:hypothetical protein